MISQCGETASDGSNNNSKSSMASPTTTLAVALATTTTAEEEAILVCRELYDPYTGELRPTSIVIPRGRSLTGDECGCCNNSVEVCPDEEELGQVSTLQGFLRPEGMISSSDSELQGRVECDSTSNDDDETSKIFVCRTFYNPLTGESESAGLCNDPAKAWETDKCGFFD